MLLKSKTGSADELADGTAWILVGLGNPDAKYQGTRHNTGFAALDYLSQRWSCPVNKSKWLGLFGTTCVEGQKTILLKPMTYMNHSGQCVRQAADFYGIPPQRVLVLCDDITQEPGHLRIRAGGSAGGHNGLKSIIQSLNSEEFPRLRIGVGAKPSPDYDLTAWVLGKFPQDMAAAVSDRYRDIEAACRLIVAGKLPQAQNLYNG